MRRQRPGEAQPQEACLPGERLAEADRGELERGRVLSLRRRSQPAAVMMGAQRPELAPDEEVHRERRPVEHGHR
ncbi:MAG: hypothetical protein H0T39_05630, partial [Actinobacteria bacterium]|nr:hypothetical protein [Actinomycetota bacterium]